MKNIKLLVLDVDGTMTDGKIYMSDSGELFKAFDIKDGCGIKEILIPAGITPLIITGRKSKMVENRCREIVFKDIHQGVKCKDDDLEAYLKEKGLLFSQVAYIGDDINDLECMKKVLSNNGIVACPNDAVSSVKEIASYVCKNNGGNGAVREFIEWLIQND